MSLEEVLAVLLGWIGLEGRSQYPRCGAPPLTVLDARGILRRGEEFGVDDESPAVFAFRFEDGAGDEVASLRLYESSYAGGGWFDKEEEVLEIRSGVMKVLVTTVLDP